MTRTPTLAALCVAALALGACSERHAMASNPKVCADFRTAKAAPVIPGSEGASATDECVKRWAYSLASSRDDAGVVANAVVAACGAQLANWNQQAINQPGSDVQATSITTGEPTNPLAEHNTFTNGRALFYVVEARAGRCSAPPMKDGVPEGIG
jgi:hypothetical protein